MKTISYLSMLSLFLLLSACSKDKKNVDVSLNNVFELDFEQTAFFKDGNNTTSIKFVEVVEESRCPEGLLCDWEGRAIVGLEIDKKPVILATLNSLDEDFSQTAKMGDYQVTLKDVNPYPKYNEPLIFKDYSVVLQITKL